MRALNFVFNRSEWSGGARFVCCRVIARGCVALLPGCGVALLPAHPVDLRARGEGVVEYPGKVACPSGRRCSTRNAVWCHSHPGFKSQRYRHCRPAPMGPGGFVMPTRRAWVACDAAGGPGCFVCPWAAARPQCLVCGPAGVPGAGRAVLLGRAALCARGRRPAREPSAPRASLGASPRSPARPRHRPRAPQPGPSRPSGALHTGGTWCVDVWLGASARCPGRPRRRPRAPQPVSYLNPISGSQP